MKAKVNTLDRLASEVSHEEGTQHRNRNNKEADGPC